MLVLSRQRDETIMIGDDIEVTVVDIRGDKVRLGITAPKEISVHRKEVYDAIRRENRAAAQVKPEDLSGLGKVGPKPAGPGNKEEKKSGAAVAARGGPPRRFVASSYFAITKVQGSPPLRPRERGRTARGVANDPRPAISNHGGLTWPVSTRTSRR
jgi:carbon storage regulator